MSITKIKSGRIFWLAATMVFLAILRRELNFLPDLLIANDFMILGRGYDWWEDAVLTVLYVSIITLLLYSRHYLVHVLKHWSIKIYMAVALLAIIQYMGENAILFSEHLGMAVEELCEVIIYIIAITCLWQLELSQFEESEKLNLLTLEVW